MCRILFIVVMTKKTATQISSFRRNTQQKSMVFSKLYVLCLYFCNRNRFTLSFLSKLTKIRVLLVICIDISFEFINNILLFQIKSVPVSCSFISER